MANNNTKAFEDAKRSAAAAVHLTGGAGMDPSKPDYQNPAYSDIADRIEMVRDVWGGTETMRAGGTAYLPKMAREKDEDYQRRNGNAVAFNATGRTTAGLAGMVFRKDADVEGPEAILEDLKDIDLRGSDFNTFGRALLDDAIRDGHQWIVVDAPPAEAGRTLEDEAVRGIRPYWIQVDPLDARNWQYEMVDGRPVLTLFVYRETRVSPVGAYGQVAEVCYRVLRAPSEGEALATYEVWKEETVEGEKRFVLEESGTTGLPVVTAAYVPTLSKVPEDSKPAVLDIVYNQIAHFQRWSLYNAALDYAVPMPWVTGIKAADVEFGANRLLALPSTEANVGYLEMTGSALDANRRQLEDLKHEMALGGLSKLSRESRAPETATSKEIDKSESDSELAVMAKALQGALNQALAFHAMYRSTEPAECAVNMDFTALRLDPQTMGVLSNMVALGQLTVETMWDALIAGEILPETFDGEKESAMLDDSMPPEGDSGMPPLTLEEQRTIDVERDGDGRVRSITTRTR